MLGSPHISYPVSLDIFVPPIAIYCHRELASGDLLAADDSSVRLHSCGSFCEGGSAVDYICFTTALASEDQATPGSHGFFGHSYHRLSGPTPTQRRRGGFLVS